MVDEINGQQAFYQASYKEQVESINAARQKWVAVRLRIAENLRERKELRRQEDQAHVDFLRATGGDSLQRELEIEDDAKKIEQLQGTHPETSALIAKRRRDRVQNGAIKALEAAGGMLENKKLAAYLGCDSHGLSGLLTGNPRIEKCHTGRQANEITEWRLVKDVVNA